MTGRPAATGGGGRPPRLRVPDGFTLIELVVTLSISALLLGFGLSRYAGYASNQRLVAAARTLAADMRTAQQEAVTRRSSITVSIVKEDPRCHGQGRGASYVIAQGTTAIKHTCLPQDVAWVSLPDSPVVFASNGGAEAQTRVQIQSARTARRYTITVEPGAGVVSDDVR